jgi:hypothetical protein
MVSYQEISVKELSNQCKGVVARLLYVVLFEERPVDMVGPVVEDFDSVSDHVFTPFQYIDGITEALDANADLTDLIPQRHSQEDIREYLIEMRRALRDRYVG